MVRIKFFLVVMLMIAGITSMAQLKNRRAEKKYSERVFHQPKSPKTAFKNKKVAKNSAKSGKHVKHFGKQKNKSQLTKAYARRKD